ncbi:MAG: alpha/beta hydrolase [Rhodothermales bacterium]
MTQTQQLHRDQPIRTSGVPPEEAAAAMVLLHGRGASAESILTLTEELGDPPGFAYAAPQAAGHTWYPYSFLAPLEQNEPWLTSALEAVGAAVSGLERAGLDASQIILLGFSQGACLALEFAARNARRYGGVIAFSGGLIGPDGTLRDYNGTLRDYNGTLSGTPVFLGCSDIDAHIPEARVHKSADVLERLGGDVAKRIYPGMGHTVNRDEIAWASALMNQLSK